MFNCVPPVDIFYLFAFYITFTDLSCVSLLKVQEEENHSSTLVRSGSFRGSHLSVRRAEVLQMLSEGDSKNGLFTLTRRRTVQPIRSNNEHGSQSSLHSTSTKLHVTDLPKWDSSEGLQQRCNSMPWLKTSSVRQGPPSKLQKATREGTPRKNSGREDTPQKDVTPDRISSSNSPITPLSTVTPTLTTSRSSLGSESQAKLTPTTPIPVPTPTTPISVVPPVKPKPHREVKKPSPAREGWGRTRTISPLVNGSIEANTYDEFDDNYTFQRSASMRAEKTPNDFSRAAKIRRSFSKKNSIKNGLSRIYFGDSQIARAAMELAEEKKPEDQPKREVTPKEDSKSPPPSQGKMAYASQKKRRFASFKGKQHHHHQQEGDDDTVDAEFYRSATLPSRPRGSFSKNSMIHPVPPRSLNHGEASSASMDEAAIQGRPTYSPPRGSNSSSQLEYTSHSKYSNYVRIEPLHVNNSMWESDGYGDTTHSTFGTLGRKPQRRRSPGGTTKMATPRICVGSAPIRKNSTSKLSPRITNGHVPNGHSDGVFDLTDPEHTIKESEERHSQFPDGQTSEKKRQSELLDQIRVGIELKKERQKEEFSRKSSSNLPWNVSAILERRLVLRPPSEDEIPNDWSEDL